MCDLGKTYLESLGLNNQIEFVTGDIFVSEYPKQHDIHFCSNTLHGFTQEHCKMVIKKSFASLPEQGTLILHDRVLEHTSPPYSPIVNTSMLMLDRHGVVHAVEDYAQWMREYGFTDVRILEVAGVPGFVCGRK